MISIYSGEFRLILINNVVDIYHGERKLFCFTVVNPRLIDFIAVATPRGIEFYALLHYPGEIVILNINTMKPVRYVITYFIYRAKMMVNSRNEIVVVTLNSQTYHVNCADKLVSRTFARPIANPGPIRHCGGNIYVVDDKYDFNPHILSIPDEFC